MDYKQHEIEWTHEKISRIWNFYAANPTYHEQFFGVQVSRYVAKFANRQLGLKRLNNILDISCGLGDVIAACVPYLSGAGKIYGTEFGENNVDIVNKRFAGIKQFAGARLVKSYPTSYESSFFDLIIATEVIEHLNNEEIEIILDEAHRLLGNGGYILITTPDNESPHHNKMLCPDCGCVFHKWQHIQTWTADSLRQKMEEHGFRAKLVMPVAWASPLRKLAVVLKPLPKTGLVYIGQKMC